MTRSSLAKALLLACASTLSCGIGGYLFLRTFQAGDCDGGCNSAGLLAAVACVFLAFLCIGGFLLFRPGAAPRTSIRAIALMAAVTVAAPGIPFWTQPSAGSRLQANQDDSFMLQAARDLPDLGIHAGERCIFPDIDCESSPAQISAVCETRGAVVLRQPVWYAFQRLPAEDFGIPPSDAIRAFPRSCAAPARP